MNDFLSTTKEILKYGGSTFAALIAGCIYITTDGFFIGNWVGADGLEAMALVFPVIIIFNSLTVLFETGGSAVVSEKLGAGEKVLAEKIMRTNYVVAIIGGIIFAVVANIVIAPIFQMFASNEAEQRIVDLAISFVRISVCGVPFLLTACLTQTFMRCIEKPTHVFYLLGTVSFTNIILDALFILGFGWGVPGAAFATLLAQIFGAVISLWYFKYSLQKLTTPWGLADVKYLIQELKIGIGFAAGTVMMCITEAFLNAILLEYNASHLLAAVTISNIILSFIFIPLNGLDTGTQPLVSKLFAEKKEEYYLNVMRYGFFWTMVLTLLMFAALMIFTEEIARFFVEKGEPVTEEMVTFLRLTFLLQPFVGLYTWLSGIMAALEDEWRNLIVSLTPLVVQIPLIWLLPKFFPIQFIALQSSLQDLAEALVAFLLIRGFLKTKGLSFKKIFYGR